jgi:hypothetical protein
MEFILIYTRQNRKKSENLDVPDMRRSTRSVIMLYSIDSCMCRNDSQRLFASLSYKKMRNYLILSNLYNSAYFSFLAQVLK